MRSVAMLKAMHHEVDTFWKEEPDATPSVDSITLIRHLLQRFPVVARQLRQRHKKRATLEITDEYDVQDLLHALLKMHFDDVRAESWTPEYAGGSSRVDFLLKPEQVVIEVKKTRATLGDREIGDELLIDIARYRQHPDCKTLVCFVYDPDHIIGNPAGLERDLHAVEGSLNVVTVISPK